MVTEFCTHCGLWAVGAAFDARWRRGLVVVRVPVPRPDRSAAGGARRAPAGRVGAPPPSRAPARRFRSTFIDHDRCYRGIIDHNEYILILSVL